MPTPPQADVNVAVDPRMVTGQMPNPNRMAPVRPPPPHHQTPGAQQQPLQQQQQMVQVGVPPGQFAQPQRMMVPPPGPGGVPQGAPVPGQWAGQPRHQHPQEVTLQQRNPMTIPGGGPQQPQQPGLVNKGNSVLSYLIANPTPKCYVTFQTFFAHFEKTQG